MENFRTSDLWLAAYLLARGNSLAGIDRRDPRRVDFILSHPPTTEDMQGFDTGEGLAPIGGLMAGMRKLKRCLYDGVGGGRHD